ncbi:DUF4054 domain-containing protein [Marinicauda sp. Alg238-R41]|uniref:DUF4054 domain-containing protein n=1 Tax=Marinicauda sp. Alg238-R41 TaxID=2993447 RepID=UPI0022E28C08|nr:DUF4054 domain-containing protein [Marinicauda sp. Alg238-R41]
MAYTQPDAAAFKARFPAFAAVDDAVITSAMARARRFVDDSWIEDDRAEAELLRCAHDLTMDGIGATREAQLSGFKKLKLDTLELEREANSAAPGSLKSTTYGARFHELLKRSHPGVKAI